MGEASKSQPVADYMDSLGDDRRRALERVRRIAREAVPEAVEALSYGMPSLRWGDRPLIGWASHKAHLAVYPFSPAVIGALATDLSGWSRSKGAVRFTCERPLDEELIRRMVELRLAELR